MAKATPRDELADASTPPSRGVLLVLAAMCVAAFAFGEWIAITQWLSGHWYLADVGNIHYCLANTLRGDFMWSPLMEGNHFAWHFTPLLVLLAPISLLSAYPIPLVTTYVLALALCPVPVYFLARRSHVKPGAALALGALFLANHFVGSLHLANHFEIFFVLFFLCLMAARPGSVAFWIFAALTVSVKEDAAGWMLAYAIFEALLASRADRKPYLKLAAACAIYMAAALVSVWLVSRTQIGGITDYASRAREIRIGTDSAITLILLYASFAFLPLAGGWRALLPLVPAPMLLVGFPFVRELAYYYSYPFLPYVTLAAAVGLGRAQSLAARLPARSATVVLASVILAVATIQAPMKTRTDGYRRIPFSISSRDRYRIDVATSLAGTTGPVVIQHGLWGITPTLADTRMLSRKNVTPQATVFLDLQSPIGMDRQEYISLTSELLQQADRGERKLLHESGDIFILSPVTQP